MAALRPFAFVVWTIGLVVMTSTACRYGPEVRGPFRGQVVDAETGKPIEGAVVVVAWTHLMNWFEGGRREVDAHEAVTDVEGRWEIPARAIPPWEGGVAGVGTRFYWFAPGYEPVEHRVTPAAGRPFRDATITAMRRLATRDERCRSSTLVAPSVPDNIARIPRYLAAQRRERQVLKC